MICLFVAFNLNEMSYFNANLFRKPTAKKSYSQWIDFITLFCSKNIYLYRVKCICHKAENVDRWHGNTTYRRIYGACILGNKPKTINNQIEFLTRQSTYYIFHKKEFKRMMGEGEIKEMNNTTLTYAS